MRSIGRGHAAAAMMSSILDLPAPISKRPWANYTKRWADVVDVALAEQLDDANQRAREARGTREEGTF